MRKSLTSLLIFLMAFSALAAPEPSNKFKMGDGTASNKVIEMNRGGSNPQIRWSESDSKLQFSNDGADFKNLGSGGGGAAGVNLLVDSDFDFEASGTTQWTTPSGGTFTKTTTLPAFGTRSGSFDASASSQVVQSAFIAIPDGLKNQAGLASCFFQTAATDYKMQVYDGTNVIAETTIAASTDYSKQALIYTHPGTGSLRLRVISASNAAAVKIDNCYMGEATTLPHSQASLIATMYFPTTASCSWSRSGTSLAAFSTVAACPGPTVEYSSGVGTPLTTDTDLPKVTINSLPAGTYLVTAMGAAYQTVGGGNNTLALSDGTTTAEGRGAGNSDFGSGTGQFVVTGVFTYSATGNRTFELFGASSTNSVDVDNQSGNYQTSFIIQRFPTSPVETYTFDTIAWKVDANQGGSNWSYSTSAQTSYSITSDTGFDLVVNTSKGSAAAYQACSGSEVASGTTCTGAESPGISFAIPRAGTVKVCMDAAASLQTGAGGALTAVYQLIETPNNSDTTITQEGGSRYEITEGAANSVTETPVHLCGTFYFSSAGQKTVRAFQETAVSGSIANNLLLGDRNTSYGQRDLHWTAQYVDQQVPAPLIPNIVTNSSASPVRVETAYVNQSAGSCSLNAEVGSWIQSLTDNGTGDCTLNFKPGTFSSAPVCVQSIIAGNTAAYTSISSLSSSLVRVVTYDSVPAATEYDFNIVCVGNK